MVGFSASQALTLLGIPDPGPITTYGLPAMRALGEIAAVIAIGSLLLAAFFVPPQKSGVLDVDGYRAVRTASHAAIVWAICSFMMVPLTLSDTSGQPFAEAIKPANLWSGLDQVEIAGAWRWTAIIAVVLAILARLTLRWWWTPLLLLVGLLGLMPLALTGHSSSGGSHDIATNSLILHLVAASLWAGGLFALLAHARRGGDYTDVAARRFSTVASICFVVMGFSGVINAIVRLPLDDVFTTTYGRLIVAKTVALIILGFFGWAQRSRALPALAENPKSRSALIRFAGAEGIVMAATIGLAIGLGRTPPPPPLSIPSIPEVELGYNLPDPPSFMAFVTDWRFDLMFGTAAVAAAILYGIGLRKLAKRGDSWPVGRTIAWMSGCAVLLIATSSGVGKYAPAVFSVHMGAHMALSMLGPVLLVLGAPITLALRALDPAGKDGVPGIREWILTALHSPFSRFITHPIVAAVLFVGGFYALYLGGIYGATVDSHSAHLLMNLPLHPQRLSLLLGGDRNRPVTAPIAAGDQAGNGLRLASVPRLLRRGIDEHYRRHGRRVLPFARPRLEQRPDRRSAAGRQHRVGDRRDPAHGGHARATSSVVAQRWQDSAPNRPCGRARPRRRPRRAQRDVRRIGQAGPRRVETP